MKAQKEKILDIPKKANGKKSQRNQHLKLLWTHNKSSATTQTHNNVKLWIVCPLVVEVQGKIKFVNENSKFVASRKIRKAYDFHPQLHFIYPSFWQCGMVLKVHRKKAERIMVVFIFYTKKWERSKIALIQFNDIADNRLLLSANYFSCQPQTLSIPINPFTDFHE